MDTVEVDGLEIAYRRAGAGPPLVLVHGGACDGRVWQPQLESLADELTVVAWDEPGAGGSSDLPDGFTLADYGRCLAGLIDALGLGPAHVCGLSWGSTVALALHRVAPGAAATLVLAGAYAGWRGSLPPEEVEARLAGVLRALEAPPGAEDPLPGWFSGPTPPHLVPLLSAIEADLRPASMRTAMALMAEADLRDVLPTIEVPTLLLWGELDVRSPLRVAHEFVEAIPHAELVVLPGTGHVSNLESPERFDDAVRRFCRRHPPA